MTLKSENYAKEFQTYAGAFKCGGAESLIPEEVESKREGKNAEKLKPKIKKDRRKWKEAANKKPEVGKHSFRSGRLEVIWVRERTSHATETREKRGSSLSPRVSSLRDRSFLRSYYFIAPTICRLSKTENTCDQKKWLALRPEWQLITLRLRRSPYVDKKLSVVATISSPELFYARSFGGECGYHCPRLWLCAHVRYSSCSCLRGLQEGGVAHFVNTWCRSTVALSLT